MIIKIQYEQSNFRIERVLSDKETIYDVVQAIHLKVNNGGSLTLSEENGYHIILGKEVLSKAIIQVIDD